MIKEENIQNKESIISPKNYQHEINDINQEEEKN